MVASRTDDDPPNLRAHLGKERELPGLQRPTLRCCIPCPGKGGVWSRTRGACRVSTTASLDAKSNADGGGARSSGICYRHGIPDCCPVQADASISCVSGISLKPTGNKGFIQKKNKYHIISISWLDLSQEGMVHIWWYTMNVPIHWKKTSAMRKGPSAVPSIHAYPDYTRRLQVVCGTIWLLYVQSYLKRAHVMMLIVFCWFVLNSHKISSWTLLFLRRHVIFNHRSWAIFFSFYTSTSTCSTKKLQRPSGRGQIAYLIRNTIARYWYISDSKANSGGYFLHISLSDNGHILRISCFTTTYTLCQKNTLVRTRTRGRFCVAPDGNDRKAASVGRRRVREVCGCVLVRLKWASFPNLAAGYVPGVYYVELCTTFVYHAIFTPYCRSGMTFRAR